MRCERLLISLPLATDTNIIAEATGGFAIVLRRRIAEWEGMMMMAVNGEAKEKGWLHTLL